MPLEVKYIKAIWAAAREHGVDREGVHEAIGMWGLKSVKDLTAVQARQLLNGLRGKSTYRRRQQAVATHGRRDHDASHEPRYMVKPHEMAMLKAAAEERGWDDEALGKFIERQLGRPVIHTLAEFNRVMWGIKAIMRREGKKI